MSKRITGEGPDLPGTHLFEIGFKVLGVRQNIEGDEAVVGQLSLSVGALRTECIGDVVFFEGVVEALTKGLDRMRVETEVLHAAQRHAKVKQAIGEGE